MKICTQCGRQNPNAAKFCPTCGTLLPEALVSEETDTPVCAPDHLAVPDHQVPPVRPPAYKKSVLPAGKHEWILAAALLILSPLSFNACVHGGQLGFTLCYLLFTAAILGYLALEHRLKKAPYGIACLLGAAVLAGSFSRSNNWLILFPAFLLVLFAFFLGLTALTGSNIRPLGLFSSILDVFHMAFCRSFGQAGAALRGLFCRRATPGARKSWGSALWGIAIAIPVLLVLVPLLMKADAAFSGLVGKLALPEFSLGEGFWTLVMGFVLFVLAYGLTLSLSKGQPRAAAKRAARKGFSAASVNGFLGVISLVYCVYLLSQLAYFFSAFQGILPRGYSNAEYARQGFFEMAQICVINLCLVGFSHYLVKKAEGRAPLATRILCLFVCLFSLVLIASAFSKMALYMEQFGLTWKRVLTSVFMAWLAICMAAIGTWLFVPKLPYMKAAVISLLILASLTCWADMDQVIARYNVTAYQSGRLERIDMDHLSGLSDSAVPWIAQLADDKDPAVAEAAQEILMDRAWYSRQWNRDGSDYYQFCNLDWRNWNYAAQEAQEILMDFLESQGCTVIRPSGSQG